MTAPHTPPRRPASIVLGLVLALLSVSLVATPARAVDNGAWSVTPTPPKAAGATPRNYFILEGDPGSTIRDKVRIQNWTTKPITFKVYGADGYNTAKDGFFALRGFDEKMVDLGRWVEPVTSQITVYGRTQVDVPVTIRIPRNATPGDHVGAVVAMNVDVEATDTDESGFEVGIQRAVGARMYVRVSGPTTPAVDVSDVHLEHDRGALPWSGSGKGTVSYTVENTGNVRLTPRARIELSGMTGQLTKVTARDLVDLLPGQEVRLSQPVGHVPTAGKVTATVSLSTAAGATDRDSTTTWLLPWPGLVALLLLLLLATWLLRRHRGVGARRLAAAEEAPVISVQAH